MKLRKYLSKKKTELRINRYRKKVKSIGTGCYLDNNIGFRGCKESLVIGNNISLGPNCSFFIHPSENGSKICIGDNTWINSNFSLVGYDCEITIGEHCSLGSEVIIYGHNHDTQNVEGNYEGFIGSQVHIGDGCWIGARVIILPGVTIGNKCIIGAGSIVTKSFPDYTMIAGNPAKIIKTYDLEKKEWIRYGK